VRKQKVTTPWEHWPSRRSALPHAFPSGHDGGEGSRRPTRPFPRTTAAHTEVRPPSRFPTGTTAAKSLAALPGHFHGRRRRTRRCALPALSHGHGGGEWSRRPTRPFPRTTAAHTEVRHPSRFPSGHGGGEGSRRPTRPFPRTTHLHGIAKIICHFHPLNFPVSL